MLESKKEVIEIRFKPQGGKIPTAALHQLIDAVSRAADKGMVLCLKYATKRRTTPQNAYYFGVVVRDITKAFQEAGNDMDEQDVHEYLKDEVGKLTRYAVLPGSGEIVTIKGSTRRLTTIEFEQYLEKVRAWAAAQGIVISLPNEGLYENTPA